MTKQELLDKKGTLVNQADEILKKAKDEGRYDLSAEENQRWETIHSDIDKIDAFVQKLDQQEKFSEAQGRRTEPTLPSTEQRQETRVVRPSRETDPNMEGLRSWLMAGCRMDLTAEAREMAARHKIDLSAKHFTIRLPGKALRANTPDGLAEWRMANNITEQRAALGVGSGSIGGFTVKDEMMRSLEVSLLAFGGMRQAATVIRTETGADLPWPTMNDTANKGRIIGENSVFTNTDVG
jgi:HK97 family phage major capsid protein